MPDTNHYVTQGRQSGVFATRTKQKDYIVYCHKIVTVVEYSIWYSEYKKKIIVNCTH